MPLMTSYTLRRLARPAALVAVVAVLALLFRDTFAQVLRLVLGGMLIALLFVPLCDSLERRLPRSAAALAALGAGLGSVALLLWLLLPTVLRELTQLTELLPRSLAQVADWLGQARAWMEGHLPGLALPETRMEGLPSWLSGMASGTLALAGSAAQVFSCMTLMLMLAYLFLRDRDRLLLRLEWLVPQSYRQTAVCIGSAVVREWRGYLAGQLLVAAAVGGLSAVGLTLLKVRSALVLGGIVGILNMVPYFGPFIGGVPAVLIALGDGWQKAALTAALLALVQQIDAAVISPRILSALTGFSPAVVLVAIYTGASLAGIGGMMLALPVSMSIRTVYRVLVQRRENN